MPPRSRNRGLTRRELVTGAAAAAGLGLAGRARVRAAPPFDLVIRGASLLDGTGAPAVVADLAVSGGRIAAIGAIAAEQGARAVTARGLCLAPGFIDIHSHSDFSLLAYPGAESRILQGVALEVAGNCGSSAAPFPGRGSSPEIIEERRRELTEEGIEPDWSDVASYFRRLEATGIALDQALLLGHGTLRENLAGAVDRPLAADEMAALVRAVEQGLDQGAMGLSTGLEYVPGRYTPAEEIAALAAVVAARGGLYASHIRNEEAGLLAAIDEALAVGRRTGGRVQVSHLKAAGRPNWDLMGEAIGKIESARRAGVPVLADAYPYTAYSTGLTVYLGAWALDGGTSALLERLRDSDTRLRLRRELAERIPIDPGDFGLVVVSDVRTAANRRLVGSSLAAIGEGWSVEPAEAALRLLEEEEGAVSIVGHGMSPQNVEGVLANPLVMIGSDGYAMAPAGRAALSRPHPRSYGAFARVLGHYCRDRKLFDLPTAVRKMTAMPAEQLGLGDRGRLATGMRADLVLFDAAKIKDEATFEEPHRHATGVDAVWVNGVAVVERGRPTGARPGRALRRA